MITEQRHEERCAPASVDLRLIEELMAALGVTAESICRAIEVNAGASEARPGFKPLTDDEWRLIKEALPPAPPQANTMDIRTFIDAVLEAMDRGGRWTDHRHAGPYPDAIRRRFGRWAHLGLWQRLASGIAGSALSSERKAELALISDRAERLCRKT